LPRQAAGREVGHDLWRGRVETDDVERAGIVRVSDAEPFRDPCRHSLLDIPPRPETTSRSSWPAEPI
jgi:hypothetical protein